MPDTTAADAIDLFCGPGGWDIAAHQMGLTVFGIDAVPPLLAHAILTEATR